MLKAPHTGLPSRDVCPVFPILQPPPRRLAVIRCGVSPVLRAFVSAFPAVRQPFSRSRKPVLLCPAL
ncbi:MAG: hypothetical protein BHW56_01680 [Acetobacter sp. 46_36]|nr:MAG: hypothetical protein BHW56_01680 [Acetobacter sp. 46_36]